MSMGLRRGVTLLAIYAIALRVILLAFLPVGAFAATSAALDPLAVICHSSADGSDPAAPAKAPLIPGHACEHCNLCSAMAPLAAPATALYALPLRTGVVQVLRPASAAARPIATADRRLARGPPVFA